MRFPFISIVMRVGRFRVLHTGAVIALREILYQVFVVIVVDDLAPI